MKDVTGIIGKEFFSPITNEAYGISDAFSGELPEGFDVEVSGEPFACDGCRNLFTENEKNETCFWDHETDRIVMIAKDWDEFASGCLAPAPIELKEGQVKSVSIGPEFAQQVGIDVPGDGWKKKHT